MSGGKHKHNRSREQNRMADKIDELAAFEEFQQQILPYLRNAIKRGATAEEIYKKAQALAAARSVTIAATSPDETKALAAIKDILDRSGGKAAERRTVEHKFKDLTDSELDAMLLSEATEADELDETEKERLQ